jgi:hypothetical protein
MQADGRRFARISLALTALVFGAFGTLFLVRPETLGIVGVEAVRPAGLVELRSIYGGLELGIALFFTLSVPRTAWHRPALMLQALSLGGAAAARLAALAIGGGAEPLVLGLAGAEAAGAVIGGLALRVLGD